MLHAGRFLAICPWESDIAKEFEGGIDVRYSNPASCPTQSVCDDIITRQGESSLEIGRYMEEWLLATDVRCSNAVVIVLHQTLAMHTASEPERVVLENRTLEGSKARGTNVRTTKCNQKAGRKGIAPCMPWLQ
jgi:hypothetical protein